MDFKLVECPKCGAKEILWFCVTGTTCKCGLVLSEDTPENRKEVRKGQVECANAFSRGFEEFQENLKREEKHWNKENVFVEFKVVTISNDKLLNLIVGRKHKDSKIPEVTKAWHGKNGN